MAPQCDFPVGTSEQDPNFRKILGMIEKYRGYETLDDLKAADSQVRERLGELLQKSIDDTTAARKRLEEGTHLRILPDFDNMMGHLRSDHEMFGDRYRSKVATCHLYRPRKDLVGELYLMDFRMLSEAKNVSYLMQEFQRMVREDIMLANIHKIDMSLQEIAEIMEKRGQTIGCMIE